MRRRDFLAVGTGTGFWLGVGLRIGAGQLSAPSGEPAALGPIDPDWAVGYWLDSDSLPDPTASFRAVEKAREFPWEVSLAKAEDPAPFQPDLVDAAKLTPDRNLDGKQVRITVIGMQPDPSVWYESELQSFFLHVHSAPRDLYPDLPPFLLWDYQREEGPKHGAPVRCKVQIEANQGLAFQTADEASGKWRQSLMLTMTDKPDLPKLRSGVYLIARRDTDSGEFPYWQDYQIRSSDPENKGARKYPFRLEGSNLVMATFPYIVLAVQL